MRIEASNQIEYSNAISTCNTKLLTLNTWIIGTKASCHVVNSMNKFNNVRLINNRNVILPNEEQLIMTHLGDVHLSKNIILYDIMFIPSFQYNLIFATKLTKAVSCELVFNSSCWTI